jgi:GTP-binding protein
MARGSLSARAGAVDWEIEILPQPRDRRLVSPNPVSPETRVNSSWNCASWPKSGWWAFPNAGKSTLLAAISKARPKIAPYPFTTLTPQIGIVEYQDYRRIVVCDVPGLVAGAHKNVGLGHAFLRHIQRCKIVVLLLDMAGSDNRNPLDDYQQLLTELELYDPALSNKPRYVVANKMDEPAAEKNLKAFKRKVRRTAVLPIAAAFDEGIDKFKRLIREAVEEFDDGQ